MKSNCHVVCLITHMIAAKGQSPACWTLQSLTFATGRFLTEVFFKQQMLGQLTATGNTYFTLEPDYTAMV